MRIAKVVGSAVSTVMEASLVGHKLLLVRDADEHGAVSGPVTVAVDAAAGQVLLVSKKRVPPELFAVPLRASAGVQQASLLGTLNGIAQPDQAQLRKNPVYGRYRSQVSGADLSPNGRVLAVLNYHAVHFYVREPGQDWSAALAAAPGRLDFPWLPQAEGIAFSLDGRRLLIASEQRPSPLLTFRVLP